MMRQAINFVLGAPKGKNHGVALREKDSSSTLVFQLEEVCGINVVAHKMKNVSGGI